MALLTAACGDDEDGGSSANLSDEEQITRMGDKWADLFGKEDERMCEYLHPDISASCELFLDGALTGSARLQATFKGATVESVEVEGDAASAEFTNGVTVKFMQDPDDAWKVYETSRSAGSASDEVVPPD